MSWEKDKIHIFPFLLLFYVEGNVQCRNKYCHDFEIRPNNCTELWEYCQVTVLGALVYIESPLPEGQGHIGMSPEECHHDDKRLEHLSYEEMLRELWEDLVVAF